MDTKLRSAAILAAALALLVAGCTDAGAPEPSAAPASSSGSSVRLRIGTGEPQGRPAADVVDELARQVEDLSGGSLTAEVSYEVAVTDSDWDQSLVRALQDGTVDVAVVPARAFDVLGMHSLDALQAPMLVTTEPLLDAVATSGTADDLLAGLDGLDLTGLALVPLGLRHLFVFGDAPVAPEDFSGLTVRAPHSETTYAFYRSLGAVPSDPNGDLLTQSILDGSIRAADSTFALAPNLALPATALGDVVPSPYALAIAVRTDLFGGLDADQQDALRRAATGTRDTTIAHRTSDADAAALFCALPGMAVVNVGDDAVAALRAAAQPVYDALAQDAGTAALLGEIRAQAGRVEKVQALAADVDAPPDPVQACGGVTSTATSRSANVPEEFPDGVYELDVTQQFLTHHGVDRATAVGHAGHWALALEDGAVVDPGCPGGTYTTDAGRLTVTMGPSGPDCGAAAGKVLFSSGWSLDGDQMTFTDVRSGHGFQVLIAALIGGQPFTKTS